MNNLGMIYYNYTGSNNLIISGIGVQFLAFLLGIIYIGGNSLYITIIKKETRFNGIKIIFINYFFYIMAYLIINIISLVWSTLLVL